MDKKERELALLAQIHQHNLAYLLLARDLLAYDRDQAVLQLGLDSDTAERLLALPAHQLAELACSSWLLCDFALKDPTLLSGERVEPRLSEARSAQRALRLLERASCVSRKLRE